jgi:hypothetical protein
VSVGKYVAKHRSAFISGLNLSRSPLLLEYLTLKFKALLFSETSVTVYQSTGYNIPEDLTRRRFAWLYTMTNNEKWVYSKGLIVLSLHSFVHVVAYFESHC